MSVHSAYENAFVLSQLKSPGNVIWLGLTDRRFEGSFLWTDQSSVDFTYWRGTCNSERNFSRIFMLLFLCYYYYVISQPFKIWELIKHFQNVLQVITPLKIRF